MKYIPLFLGGGGGEEEEPIILQSLNWQKYDFMIMHALDCSLPFETGESELFFVTDCKIILTKDICKSLYLPTLQFSFC